MMSLSASQIGSALKAAREAAGLSQEDAADHVDTSSITISRWERGVRTPPRPATLLLAKLYGRSPEEFGEKSEGLGKKVPRGTSTPTTRPAGDPLRALRIVQNDVERQLIELGMSDETLAFAGQLFADLTRTLRGLLAGEHVPTAAEQVAAATGARHIPPHKKPPAEAVLAEMERQTKLAAKNTGGRKA